MSERDLEEAAPKLHDVQIVSSPRLCKCLGTFACSPKVSGCECPVATDPTTPYSSSTGWTITEYQVTDQANTGQTTPYDTSTNQAAFGLTTTDCLATGRTNTDEADTGKKTTVAGTTRLYIVAVTAIALIACGAIMFIIAAIAIIMWRKLNLRRSGVVLSEYPRNLGLSHGSDSVKVIQLSV